MDKMAIVDSSGTVKWTPHGRLRSYCRLDLSLFPFDTHRCSLDFASWSYDQSLVNINLNPAVKNHHRRFIEVSDVLLLLLLLLLTPTTVSRVNPGFHYPS